MTVPQGKTGWLALCAALLVLLGSPEGRQDGWLSAVTGGGAGPGPPWAVLRATVARSPLAAPLRAGLRDPLDSPVARPPRRRDRAPPRGKAVPRPGLVKGLLQRAGVSATALSSALKDTQRLDWRRLRPDTVDGQQVREEVRQLLVALRDAAATATAHDVSRAMFSLTKLQQERGFAALRLLTEVSQLAARLAARLSAPGGCSGLDGRQASTLVWAIGKLRVPQPRAALLGLCRHMLEPGVWDSMTPIDVVKAAYGLANSQVAHEPFLCAVSHTMVDGERLALLDGQGVANLVWAYAKLGRSDAALFGAVAARVAAVPSNLSMKPQEVSNTAWAFATLGIRNEAVMAALADRVVEGGVLATMNAQEVSNTAWAFATLGIHNEAVMAALADRVMEGGVLATMNAQGVANTAWAFATLGIHNEAVMAALADRVMEGGVLATMKP
eukprot:EG_transcript_12568